MRKTFQVVDDFYIDPYRVRTLALEKGQWSEPKTENGVVYDRETYNSFSTPQILGEFERLLARPLETDPATMGFGVFALTDAQANADLTTHYDDTDWAGVVYLVPPDNCSGGLSFYRHRSSGLLGPPTDDAAQKHGFRDRDHWLAEVYFPDKLRSSAWEEIAHVGMKFNRLVLMRGSDNFHRASSGFGGSLQDGRLTQRFFFNDAKEADLVA